MVIVFEELNIHRKHLLNRSVKTEKLGELCLLLFLVESMRNL